MNYCFSEDGLDDESNDDCVDGDAMSCSTDLSSVSASDESSEVEAAAAAAAAIDIAMPWAACLYYLVTICVAKRLNSNS